MPPVHTQHSEIVVDLVPAFDGQYRRYLLLPTMRSMSCALVAISIRSGYLSNTALHGIAQVERPSAPPPHPDSRMGTHSAKNGTCMPPSCRPWQIDHPVWQAAVRCQPYRSEPAALYRCGHQPPARETGFGAPRPCSAPILRRPPPTRRHRSDTVSCPLPDSTVPWAPLDSLLSLTARFLLKRLLPAHLRPSPPLKILLRHPQPEWPVMPRVIAPNIQPVRYGLAIQICRQLHVLVQAHVPFP